MAGKASEDEDPEEALIDAHTVIAAIGLVPAITSDLETAAEKLSNKWLDEHRVAIKSLSDEQQEIFRQIREMSKEPMDIDLARPNMWLQPTIAREANGKEVDLPRFQQHMLCGEDGLFPIELGSSWEGVVLKTELDRKETVAWYRNPSRASQDSLGVTYEDGGEVKIVRPDFIFFALLPDGTIAADIIDPHGTQFGDALPKLRGLARYAEANSGVYRRIEAVAKVGDTYRVLDLIEAVTRAAISDATSATELYRSSAASNYDTTT